jgi:O-antigen/teichoic acid export membrane protein
LILRLTVAFISSNAIRAAIGFATAILTARQLGAADFGRWTLCMAVASTLTAVLDLGFGVLLTRDAARSPVRRRNAAASAPAALRRASPKRDLNDDELADSAVSARRAFPRDGATIGAEVSNALLARLGLLAPVAAVVVAVTAPADSAGLAKGLSTAVLLAAAGVAYGCLSAALRGWPEWLVPVLAVESAGALLQLAGTWRIVGDGGGFVALLWLAIAVQVAQLLAAAFLWLLSRDRHDPLAAPTPAGAAALVRRSIPFALSGLIANAHLRLAPLALGAFGGVEQVALFGAAQRFASLAKMLPQSAFAGALPVLSREVQAGGADRVRSSFERAIAAIAVASAAALALLAPFAVRVAYGRSFQPAAPVLAWLAVALVPMLTNNARQLYLYAAGHERTATVWSAVALLAQAAGCALLIPRFGAAGAAFAIGAGEAVVWWPLRRSELVVEPIVLAGGPVSVVAEDPVAR